MFRFSASLILVTVLTSACAREPIQRGTNLYADGQYIEAAEVFERNEYRLPDMSAEDQARYGLYRGLTLLVLGDLRGAHHWFSYARNIERRYPGSLGAQRVALLERGSYELGVRVLQTPEPPEVTSAVAEVPSDPVDAPAAEAEGPPTPGESAEPPVEKRSLVP